MCTDLRLVRLGQHRVSARTMDFPVELGSRLQVVPPGESWQATPTGTAVDALRWTNAHGYVAIDALRLGWGAGATVQDVRDAFAGVQLWNAPFGRFWPEGPMPASFDEDSSIPLHLAV